MWHKMNHSLFPVKYKFLMKLALVFALVFLPLYGALAVDDDNLFELGPGSGVTDIVGNGNPADGPDWADIFDANGNAVNLYGGAAAVFLKDDLAIGTQEDRTIFVNDANLHASPSTWQWNTNPDLLPQVDLSNTYLYAKPNEAGELVLFGGVERLYPAGMKYVHIEVNQQVIALDKTPACGTDQTGGTSDLPPCEFTGERTENDLLFLVDYGRRGVFASLEAYRWNGSDWEFLGHLTAQGCDTNDVLCAFNNASSINGGPWPNYSRFGEIQTLPANGFTEFGVNVSQLLKGATPCYSTVRAGSSFQKPLVSKMIDFALGHISMCDAGITISDGGVNEVADAHEFTVTVTKKDGSTGYTWQPASNVLVTGTAVAQNGALAFFENGQTCTTGVDGTCVLTVNSPPPGRRSFRPARTSPSPAGEPFLSPPNRRPKPGWTRRFRSAPGWTRMNTTTNQITLRPFPQGRIFPPT